MKIDERKLQQLLEMVKVEFYSATGKFGAFHNAHEGYAVIKEEVDELWGAIKDKRKFVEEQRDEAVQVAAMAVRFLYDL